MMVEHVLEAETAFYTVLTIMLLPDDPEPLQANLIVKAARECPEARAYMDVDRANEYVIGRYLAGKPASEGMQNGGPGAVAGDVLLHLFQMDHEGIAEPSLRKARWITADYTRGAVHDGSPKLGYKDSSIKSYWRQFRRVAHLWAAFRIIQFQNADPRDEHGIFDRMYDNTYELLAIAKRMQGYADQFVPSREKNLTLFCRQMLGA